MELLSILGVQLFKLKDRRDSDLSLSATCEEGITQLVNEQVSSYRQLPIRLYQIGIRFHLFCELDSKIDENNTILIDLTIFRNQISR